MTILVGVLEQTRGLSKERVCPGELNSSLSSEQEA